MKPIIILPPNLMSADDIQRLRDNDLCVVEASDPSAIRFLDPAPCDVTRDALDNAAIKLTRDVLNPDVTGNSILLNRDEIRARLCRIILAGSQFDPNVEKRIARERLISQEAKEEELRHIAREEARAEAAEKKAEREAKKAAKKSNPIPTDSIT